MNFWSPYPFVRITLCFILGVIFGAYSEFHFQGLAIASVIVLVISLTVFVVLRWPVHDLLGSGLLIMIAFLGYLHVRNFEASGILPNNFRGYTATIISDPLVIGNNQRMRVSLKTYVGDKGEIPANCNVLVYVRQDSTTSSHFNYGDKVAVFGSPVVIGEPTNPGEFDFAFYWKNKGVVLQDFIESEEINVIGYEPESRLIAYSLKIRNYCEEILINEIPKERERNIALALLLGIKHDLDNEVKSAYASAGAMHVLAVSGLHVGILYLFILWIFRPLKKHQNGEVIIGIVSLGILWIYAFVTGFSPSVQRAVVMFSVFIIGRMFKRKRNIYNSLAFSAFILMLINPRIIFEVGFQLSYLAVFGIVFLQPKILQLWSPDSWFIHKVWEISSVSLAAQIATFPLGIYYFNQFPNLFLVSNLIVIPSAFLVLIIGLLTLILAPLQLAIFGLLSDLLAWLLWLMNESVLLIDSFSFSLMENLHFNTLQLVLTYLTLLFTISLFLYKRYKFFLLSLTAISMAISIELIETYNRSEIDEIVFYDVNRNTVIDFRQGHYASLYVSDTSTVDNILKFIIEPDRLRSGIMSNGNEPDSFYQWAMREDGLEVGLWGQHKFLRLSGNSWKKLEYNGVNTDYLIVSNNVVNNVDEIQRSFSFKSLIIDSSNSVNRSAILETQARERALDVHSIHSNGALIIKI